MGGAAFGYSEVGSQVNTLKEIGTQILHAIIAMIVLLPLLWPKLIFTWAISAFLTGLLREDSQHRAHFDSTPEGWAWIKKGFPIGGRWRDMWAFAVGGLADGLIYYFVIA